MTEVRNVFSVIEGPVVDCSKDPGLTKQSFADECDINVLIARYGEAVVASPGGAEARGAFFGDFSDGLDYLEAQAKLLNAQEAFKSLPAAVRRRFDNDPAMLLEFMADPANLEEARKLDLVPSVVEPAVPASAAAVPASPAAADAAAIAAGGAAAPPVKAAGVAAGGAAAPAVKAAE